MFPTQQPEFDPLLGIRSHTLQLRISVPWLKIPHSATKTQHSHINKYRHLKKNLKKQLIKQINNLPDKEFEASVISVLIELGKRIDEHHENFNKELKNIKKD